MAIRYKGPLRAPIAKGDRVATLLVRVPGQGETRLPLVTAEEVPAAGMAAQLRNGVLAMLGQ